MLWRNKGSKEPMILSHGCKEHLCPVKGFIGCCVELDEVVIVLSWAPFFLVHVMVVLYGVICNSSFISLLEQCGISCISLMEGIGVPPTGCVYHYESSSL